MKLIKRIATDPRPGDKVEHQGRTHPTRTVRDRYFSGDVQYAWNMQCGYFGRCTLIEWQQFCDGARVIKSGRRRR